MPIVIPFNEAKATEQWDWKDVEGARHHFPNVYNGLVRPGERFIYYRGSRRLGGKRGVPEYFGQGVIGEVWPEAKDPPPARKRDQNWFAAIEEYQPFEAPVPAKFDGRYLEPIAQNRFQNIRSLAEGDYLKIVRLAAGEPIPPDQWPTQNGPARVVHVPEGQRPLAEAASLLLLPQKRLPPSVASTPDSGGTRRQSRRAKVLGDLAEELALKFIRAIPGAKKVRHVAAMGEKPGWDISYVDAAGVMHRVEVKGTSGKAFANFELTAGELAAAHAWGDGYWLYLVADCEGIEPKLTRLQNPAALFGSEFQIAPTSFRVWREVAT